MCIIFPTHFFPKSIAVDRLLRVAQGAVSTPGGGGQGARCCERWPCHGMRLARGGGAPRHRYGVGCFHRHCQCSQEGVRGGWHKGRAWLQTRCGQTTGARMRRWLRSWRLQARLADEPRSLGTPAASDLESEHGQAGAGRSAELGVRPLLGLASQAQCGTSGAAPRATGAAVSGETRVVSTAH